MIGASAAFASIRQALAARGCELLFLPPCSSDFTPIEQAFSKLKAILRGRGARTREDTIAWFAHAGHPLPAQDKWIWL